MQDEQGQVAQKDAHGGRQCHAEGDNEAEVGAAGAAASYMCFILPPA